MHDVCNFHGVRDVCDNCDIQDVNDVQISTIEYPCVPGAESGVMPCKPAKIAVVEVYKPNL